MNSHSAGYHPQAVFERTLLSSGQVLALELFPILEDVEEGVDPSVWSGLSLFATVCRQDIIKTYSRVNTPP